MKKYIFDFLRILFSSLVILFFLMLPEILFGFLNSKLAVCFDPDKLGMVFLLSVALSVVKSKKFFIRFLIVFGILQIVQFCSMAYFGVYLTPYSIDFIFLETGDILTEIKDVWYKYLYVFVLIGVSYFILGCIVAKDVLNRVSFKYGWVLPMIYVAGFFYRATTPDGIFQMLFKNTCYASYNTVNSFSAYFANILPQKLTGYQTKEVFPDYQLTNIETDPNKPMNIIFVVGESINVNHLSLFGYDRRTTPELEKYAAHDPHFIYKKAWAAGVNTLISLPMIYNIQVNPKNYQKLIERDSYLFKMAQENGFKVTYIEAQNASLFKKTSLSHYDKAFVYSSSDGEELKGESGFLDQVFKQIDLTGRNLIIVHKRNVHSPYNDNYMYEPEKYTFFDDPQTDARINEYDNAMLYEDMLLMKILNFARSSDQETYFYYLSDHGEALGKNGIWGHGHLDPADLEIPFMFTMFNVQDEAYLSRLKALDQPCTHDISLLIAEKLGWKVEIPGEDLNICQVNGRDTMGRAGILKIIKKSDGSAEFKLEQ